MLVIIILQVCVSNHSAPRVPVRMPAIGQRATLLPAVNLSWSVVPLTGIRPVFCTYNVPLFFNCFHNSCIMPSCKVC
jgi:hypothetical protein